VRHVTRLICLVETSDINLITYHQVPSQEPSPQQSWAHRHYQQPPPSLRGRASCLLPEGEGRKDGERVRKGFGKKGEGEGEGEGDGEGDGVKLSLRREKVSWTRLLMSFHATQT